MSLMSERVEEGDKIEVDEEFPIELKQTQSQNIGSVDHHSSTARHNVARNRPLLAMPLQYDATQRGQVHEWLPAHARASPWIALFYDLVFVSILTLLSTNSEIGTPGHIVAFFSFFVLLWVIWLSQTIFDSKYQADDWYSRFLKFVQLIVFIYIGAASAGWNPAHLSLDLNDTSEQAAINYQAQQSFLTVTIAYACSRAVLSAQYCFTIYLAHKVGRPKVSLLIPAVTCVISGVLACTSAALKFSTRALIITKVVLLYLGVLIECAGLFIEVLNKTVVKAPAHELTERFGAITLIVLGEGFISIVRAFSLALSGFSLTDTDTYVQVICAMTILFCLWSFFYDGLSETPHRVGRKRTILWIFSHFPLHFMLLLLLAAVVNNIHITAYFDGIGDVLDKTTTVALTLPNNVTTFDTRKYSLQMERLPLYPRWSDQVQQWSAYVQQNGNDTQEFGVSFFQYIAQILSVAAPSYGIELDPALQYSCLEFSARNNDTLSAIDAIQELTHLVEETFDETFSGALWLLPSAGGSILVGALVNWIRSGFWDWLQILFGVILCLLGCLNIGHNEVPLNTAPDGEVYSDLSQASPLYKAIGSNWALAIVAIALGLLWCLDLLRSWWYVRRSKR